MLSADSDKRKRLKRGNIGHNTVRRWSSVTLASRKPRNAIRNAVDVLFPTSLDPTGVAGKPLSEGLEAELTKLLNGHATLSALRRWRIGNRGAPNWFIAVLRDRLLQRQAEIAAAIAGLDQLPERRGLSWGFRQYNAQKRAKAAEEQERQDRETERNRILRGQ
jgi:hypothetical protein